jgi:Tfp pilus assembly protein PilX
MSNRRRGLVAVDTLLAVLIALTLAGLMATSAVWSRRAADHAADARAATAAAEAALIDLAQGRQPPADVRVQPLSAEPPVPGHRWVRVTAAVHGRSVALVGLARGDQ